MSSDTTITTTSLVTTVNDGDRNDSVGLSEAVRLSKIVIDDNGGSNAEHQIAEEEDSQQQQAQEGDEENDNGNNTRNDDERIQALLKKAKTRMESLRTTREEYGEDEDGEEEEEERTVEALLNKAKTRMEKLEIDDNNDGDSDEYMVDDGDDGVDDLEQLLGGDDSGGGRRRKKKKKGEASSSMVYRVKNCGSRCVPCLPTKTESIGNMTIVYPDLFFRTGWGIMGPHAVGPLCVVTIILSASGFFIHQSYTKIGPLTTLVCVLFTMAILFYFFNTAYRDPGIVAFQPTPTEEEQQNSRWCDFCQVYQPPDGSHCPDCNVCVAGFDHHCFWMGTSIGKNNFKQFVAFNLSWLFYLAYCIIWVSFLAPVLYF